MADNTVTTYNGHNESAAYFNDHYAVNKEQILEIYDRAIEMAKEEE